MTEVTQDADYRCTSDDTTNRSNKSVYSVVNTNIVRQLSKNREIDLSTMDSIMLMQYDATNMEQTSGYKGVMRLAHENPKWVPIVQAALEVAKSVKADFAGAWVLNKAKESGTDWFPNLRILVTHGILKKEDTSRGGRRAYYSIPDVEGVKKALNELSQSRL